jgi:hypothetical protein
LTSLDPGVGDDPHVGMLLERLKVGIHKSRPIGHEMCLGDATSSKTRRRFHQDHLPTCFRLLQGGSYAR